MKNQLYIYAVVALVVGLGVGFFVGTKYDGSSSSSGSAVSQNGQRRQGGNAQFGGGAGGAGAAGGANRAGVTTGDIIAKDSKSVTVKMRDGSTKIVFFAASTTIVKSVDGTADDLVVGKSIVAMGSANADGSVTAQNIQVRQPGLR